MRLDSKSQLEKIYELSLAGYIGIFLLVSVINEVGILKQNLGIVNWVVFSFGLALLLFKFKLYDMRTHLYNRFPTILLTIFLCLNVISVFLNVKYDFAKNLQSLGYMLMIFLLVYDSTDYYLKRNMFKTLAKLIIAGSLFLVICSLTTYILGISYRVEDIFILGYDIDSNRLWGVVNPNTGGLISLVSIACSLYFINKVRTKKIIVVLFNIFNIFCQYSYIVLAQSRAVNAVSLIFVFIVSLAFLYNQQIKKIMDQNGVIKYESDASLDKYKASNLVMSAFLGLIICIMVSIASSMYREALILVPKKLDVGLQNNSVAIFSRNLKSDYPDLFIQPDNLEKLDAKRKPVSQNSVKERGRIFFWERTIENVEDSFLLGLSHDGLITEVKNDAPDKSVEHQIEAGGVHSIVFTVLGSSGVAGLVVFMLFVVIQNLEILRMFYMEYKHKHRFSGTMVLVYATVIAIAVADLVESRLLYNMSFLAFIFWFFTGMLQDKCSYALYQETVEKEEYAKLEIV